MECNYTINKFNDKSESSVKKILAFFDNYKSQFIGGCLCMFHPFQIYIDLHWPLKPSLSIDSIGPMGNSKTLASRGVNGSSGLKIENIHLSLKVT